MTVSHRPVRHCLVLGGSGFVGTHLLSRFSELGISATVLTRTHAKMSAARVLPNVQFVAGNPYDVAVIARHAAGADAVINLVGILNETGFGGGGFRRAHVELTEVALAAAKQAGAWRFIQMSSLNAGKGASHYLKSRGEAEARVRAAGVEGLAVTIFQPSVIFGPGDGLVERFAGLLKLAPVLPLACPNARLQPVFIGDVVDALARSLEDPKTFGVTLELGGPEILSLIDIVAAIRAELGVNRVLLPLPNALARIQAAICDFVPGRPFSTDNYLSLKTDSVVVNDGLRALGITPRPFKRELGAFLHGHPRQRRYDQYRRAD
jgi:uncharacterized protein YbjT (DUF2867 family)